MNEDTFNKKQIEAYLLGSLSETEAEHLDELSFTDEDFADALKAIETDLIDSYVHNNLNGAVLEKFKSHYLASPLRRERVEFARNFQRFAEREITEPNQNFIAEKTESKSGFSKFLSSLNIFKNQNSFLQIGFTVAALLFMILSGLWIFNNRFGQTENQIAKVVTPTDYESQPPRVEEQIPVNSDLQTGNSNSEKKTSSVNVENNSSANHSEGEKTNKQTITEPARTPKPKEMTMPSKPLIASFLFLPSLRGNSRIQTITIAQNITDAAIQIQLESDDYPAYRVELIDQSTGKSLGRRNGLKTKNKGENKQLNVSFPANLLKSQIYTLQVSGVSANGNDEIISDYPFKVVR